ncbi:hypothetical protein [Micromonospora costi]|uniref:Ribosomal protein L7/L12 C-terminal domain-containing protein n=1 Tax=Micromonospora costi TaxID=1530042 RepID=A0A3B0AED3_9ACTN|nr:hypothetical protein [Micromonospora costi]RKN58723.1 hypothetical protein D7193_09410 [Micromonospora costi]
MLRWRPVRIRVFYELPLFVPVDIQVRAHDLIESGSFRQAVRVLRKQAQLDRSEAKVAASRLRSGEVLPDFPMPGGPDLASRVQGLRDSGRRKEAIFAVRSERNVGPVEAEAFVDSV